VAKYALSILCAGFGKLITRSLLPLPRTWSVAAVGDISCKLTVTSGIRKPTTLGLVFKFKD